MIVSQARVTEKPETKEELEERYLKLAILEDINYHFRTWGMPMPLRVVSLRYSKRAKKLFPETGLVGFVKRLHEVGELYYAQAQDGGRYLMPYGEAIKLVEKNELNSLLELLRKANKKGDS